MIGVKLMKIKREGMFNIRSVADHGYKIQLRKFAKRFWRQKRGSKNEN